MEFKKLANRSVRVGMVLLFCCITFGQMTALSAAADSEEDVCTGADMGSYARLAFCLPPEVVVVPETMAEADYAGGREVGASMLLDGARVGLHLLYPCQAPQKELESAELKPYLEAYDPIMAQAQYNDSETGPVLWGQVGNQIFVAYQPNNLTVVLLLMDMNMSEETVTNFLGNLSIDPNEGTTPLTPGYCTDTTVVSDEASAISAEATDAPVEETAVENPAVSEPPAEKPTLEETVKDNAEARKEKMEADRAAAMAKLEEARARR